MNKKIQALRDPEFRNALNVEVDHPAGMQDVEDEALSSITGGCNQPCGGPSTRLWSCVPPNEGCP